MILLLMCVSLHHQLTQLTDTLSLSLTLILHYILVINLNNTEQRTNTTTKNPKQQHLCLLSLLFYLILYAWDSHTLERE